jgi:hypothetical protein
MSSPWHTALASSLVPLDAAAVSLLQRLKAGDKRFGTQTRLAALVYRTEQLRMWLRRHWHSVPRRGPATREDLIPFARALSEYDDPIGGPVRLPRDGFFARMVSSVGRQFSGDPDAGAHGRGEQEGGQKG